MNSTYVITELEIWLQISIIVTVYFVTNVHIGHSNSCVKPNVLLELNLQQLCCTTPSILAMSTVVLQALH